MFRWMAMVFGLALGVLWLVGVRGAIAPDWLSWADLVGAVAAFLAAGSLRTMSSRSLRASISFVFSAGLFAVWFIAISTDVPPMLAWWHFAVAMGFLFLGVGTFPTYQSAQSTAPEKRSRRFLTPEVRLGDSSQHGEARFYPPNTRRT